MFDIRWYALLIVLKELYRASHLEGHVCLTNILKHILKEIEKKTVLGVVQLNKAVSRISLQRASYSRS